MPDGSDSDRTKVTNISDEQLQFGWLTTDVARLMRTVFDRRVRTLGLTRPQWLALVRLNRRPGASQVELARPYFTEEYIRSLATVRGVQVKARYAEAFEAIRVRL